MAATTVASGVEGKSASTWARLIISAISYPRFGRVLRARWCGIVAIHYCSQLSGRPVQRAYPGWVTAKEHLQQLVADPGEEQASRALGLLEPLIADLPESRRTRRLPRFAGIGESGPSDVSERADELLAEGFGRVTSWVRDRRWRRPGR